MRLAALAEHAHLDAARGELADRLVEVGHVPGDVRAGRLAQLALGGGADRVHLDAAQLQPERRHAALRKRRPAGQLDRHLGEPEQLDVELARFVDLAVDVDRRVVEARDLHRRASVEYAARIRRRPASSSVAASKVMGAGSTRRRPRRSCTTRSRSRGRPSRSRPPRARRRGRTPRASTSSSSSPSGVTFARNSCMARLGATAFTRTPASRRLERDAARERHHARLGRGVVRLALLRAPAEHRGVVHDRAAARARSCAAARRASCGTAEVSVTSSTLDHCSSRHLDDRFAVPPRPGVVDQHVDVAELARSRAAISALHLVLARDVAAARRAAACPSPRRALRRGLAQAAARACR